MANQEQYDLLRQSVSTWNEWRRHHPNTPIDLKSVNLSSTDLSAANLSSANLVRANLGVANLVRADLSFANLADADLCGTDLSYANLSAANLNSAHLIEADLIGTTLLGANLVRTNLSYANLSAANLNSAHLIETDLTGACLNDAEISQTIFSNVDLRSVIGLETIKHWGPSTIEADTLLRSEGRISKIFIRKASADNSLILFTCPLINRPIEYLSCFINYSSKDRDFAERLYTDLQKRDVPCQHASYDLQTSDTLPRNIEEIFHLYDKFIVILSKNSIASSWFESVVRAVQRKEEQLKQEKRRMRIVLCPIMIDKTIEGTKSAWAAQLFHKRNLGDFTQWKNHILYKRQLDELLRNLQTLQLTYPYVANDLHKLNACYEAEVIMYERKFGATHMQTANSLNNLAELYRVEGEYAKAEPLYMRALMIYENAVFPASPNAATILNNLALLYRMQERYEEAEALYIRSLAIYEKAFPPNRSDTAATFKSYTSLL